MIGFWILAGTVTLATLAILAYALFTAKGNAASTAEYDVQVYRDQLKELDRDLARGVIPESEAQRARNEISRRLLDADREAQAGSTAGRAPAAASWAAVAVSATVLIGGGLWIYFDEGAPGYQDMPLAARQQAAAEAAQNRPTQAEVEAQQPAWTGPPADAPADYIALVKKLRKAVKEHPDDLQGQMLLAQHEAAIGNTHASRAAMQKVVEIKGDSASSDDYAKLADLMVLAARGYVSPEAEAALKKSLELNPDNKVSLYYTGLLYAQTGRASEGFHTWRDLLRNSQPSDPWVAPIRAHIGELAAMAGESYQPDQMPSGGPGPTAADIAAADKMTPEERTQMVDDMVNRLMDRLATQGGPAPDWARLISVLAIKGDTEKAAGIWGEALVVFKGRPDDLAQINEAASKAGLKDPVPFEPPAGAVVPGPSSTPGNSAPQAAPAPAPAPSAPAAPALAGPTQEEMNAASAMTKGEQQDMINGMVSRLENELMTNGGPPARWQQLFKVLGVLGDKDRARKAWAAAQKAFADDPAGLEQVRQSAAAVGATTGTAQ